MITLKETAMFLTAAMMSFCSLHAATGDGYAKRFTITPGAPLGLTANLSLADFPVLVHLSTDITDFSYDLFENATLGENETVPSNLDILFVDENDTVLPYEIQIWDPTGTSLVWVKVPTLTAATEITCYLGNANATNVNIPGLTWTAYEGVWHFDNVGKGGTSPDSTTNGYTAICAASDTSFTTGLPNGPLGGYRENQGNRTVGEGDLPNGTESGIAFDGTASIRPEDPTRFTVSAYFLRNTTGGGWDHLFYKKVGSADGHGWGQEFYSDHTYPNNLRVFGAGDANQGAEIAHGITPANTWCYLSIVYDARTTGASTRTANC